METITQAQAAALKGVTVRRLYQIAKEADDPPPRSDDGTYSATEYGAWLIRQATGAAFDYTEERARLTHHQANKTALEEEVLRGDLIPAEEVEQMLTTLVSNARAKFLGLPVKAAQAAIQATEIRDIERDIQALVYEALNEFANEFSSADS